MNNYAINHRLQFSSNTAGHYKFAVVAGTVIIGRNSSIDQLRYFMNQAAGSEITDVLHLGPALSRDDVAAWPRIPGLTTWFLFPSLALPNGSPHRDDLATAPSGFVLTHQGQAVPVFLHYGSPYLKEFGELTAVHLAGGLPYHGFQQLPDGGVVVSIGTFPPVGAIVEMWFDESDELKCETYFWEFTPRLHAGVV